MVKVWSKILFFSVISLLLFFIPTSTYAVVVGSRVTASSQGFTTFPNTDTNNRLLGFARFSTGFMLQDSTTSCTFEDYMPVVGTVHLNNGRFTLRKDMTIAEVSTFLSPAIIEANTFCLEAPKKLTTLNFPETNLFSYAVTSSWHLGPSGATFSANSVDWAINDGYLASGLPANTGRELKIGYLTGGTTITTTLDVEIGRTINTVRWHPSQRYLAAGVVSGVLLNNLFTYEHRVYNGTLVQRSSIALVSDVRACAWHLSGNYLVVGTADLTTQLLTYPVTNGLLGASTGTSLGIALAVSREALSFSKGGNQIVIGLAGTPVVGSSNLFIYNFNAGSLTLSSSLRVPATVQAVDWNPTTSYIAAGLASGTTASIRVYDATGTQVIEALNARTGGLNGVNSVHWDKTGTFLAVATQVTASSAQTFLIYYFDKVNLTLAPIFSATSNDAINTVRWSRAGSRVAHGNQVGAATDHQIYVRSQASTLNRVIFKNGSLILNSDLNLIGEFHAAQSCKINARGKRITFNDSSSSFVVRPRSSLLIENAELDNLSLSSIRCMEDAGTVTLSNCVINLSQNFTFSRGSILFNNDVVFTGTNQFNYTSGVGSTISSLATVLFDRDSLVSYAPRRANVNLLSMIDVSSQLYLNGCTLQSTSTGLRLMTGTLILDNNVTLSSSAVFNANALWLDSGLNIILNGAANVQLFGKVRYL